MTPTAPIARASPDPRRNNALDVVRALRGAGFVAYFAGGCVRDELMGNQPADYDVATDAPPPRVKRLFPQSQMVGAAFGVVIVKHAQGGNTEVATFRADGEYSDKRRPDAVRFSTPDEDAKRRDFTVNALFLDPFAPAGSGVIDFVGGVQDLHAMVLRAVGDPHARLEEDHLRALRAVRLAAKLGFGIEPQTADAIRVCASGLTGVSRERIGEEIRAMLTHPSRARAAVLLHELGLDGPICSVGGSAPGPPKRDGLLANLREVEAKYPVALAAWALDVGLLIRGGRGGSGGTIPVFTTIPALLVSESDRAKQRLDAGLAELRSALCLSNAERRDLSDALVGLEILGRGWPGLGVAAQKRVGSGALFAGGIALMRAADAAKASMIEARVEELTRTFGGLSPTPLLTGDDLSTLGLRPGPVFKEILERVYDAQLEGTVRGLAGAEALARTLASQAKKTRGSNSD